MKRAVLLLALTLCLSACNQNIELVDSGKTIENSPKPAVDTEATPLVRGSSEGIGTNEGDRDVPPFVKAYFMHMWVEALYDGPKNKNPNPNWSSPLIDPVNNRVWCTDCHVSKQIDFAKIPKIRHPLVEEYENNKDFMAGLMKKWVARLNSDRFGARAKLKGPVTCLTCHATNPEL